MILKDQMKQKRNTKKNRKNIKKKNQNRRNKNDKLQFLILYKEYE